MKDAGWFHMEAEDFERMLKAQKTSWIVKVQKGGRITLPKELMKQMEKKEKELEEVIDHEIELSEEIIGAYVWRKSGLK